MNVTPKLKAQASEEEAKPRMTIEIPDDELPPAMRRSNPKPEPEPDLSTCPKCGRGFRSACDTLEAGDDRDSRDHPDQIEKCVVTGAPAGSAFACGDCDPCTDPRCWSLATKAVDKCERQKRLPTLTPGEVCEAIVYRAAGLPIGKLPADHPLAAVDAMIMQARRDAVTAARRRNLRLAEDGVRTSSHVE